MAFEELLQSLKLVDVTSGRGTTTSINVEIAVVHGDPGRGMTRCRIGSGSASVSVVTNVIRKRQRRI